MTCLAIDTTGENCTAALRLSDGSDRVLSDRIGRGHAEHLAPMVERLLAEASLPAGALSRIGVTIGPGSFAGTRVGVAFARGLALACDAGCVGISNLAILARQANSTSPLAVLHDAKRGEAILQIWRGPIAEAPERIAVSELPGRILERGGSGCTVTGSGASLLPPGFTDLGIATMDPEVLLTMTSELDLPTNPPTPFYARPPDAKLPGGVTPP